MPLSKRMSTKLLEKSAVNTATSSNDHSPPPAYTAVAPDDANANPPDITAAFSNLSLDTGNTLKPSAVQCVAHLKLLEAFHQLREDVALHDGLFGIHDHFVPSGESDARKSEILTRIREKRWATYVAKAAKRFECWWDKCVEPGARKFDLTNFPTAFIRGPEFGSALKFDKSDLPPLDVIMVWHAYQLNPRDFLEDCIRHGKMNFWRTGMPWSAIDACISSETFAFEAPAEAVKQFVDRTALPWDSNNDKRPNRTLLNCPKCSTPGEVPWTTCDSAPMWQEGRDAGKLDAEILCTGLSDAKFSNCCATCNFQTSHEGLKLHKFFNDISLLQRSNVPMPGTVLSVNGVPETPISLNRHPSLFPNRFIRGPRSEESYIYQELVRETPRYSPVEKSMDFIRVIIEKGIKDRNYLKTANHTYASRLQRAEKIAVRRMMSHYWTNFSPFAIDLASAVIRQGSFIEKMHSIDWLHSPACVSTMTRLITKYERYIDIIAKYPNSVAVPTLDVDLAWHTHQLSPPSYFTYTTRKTKTFVDHDDKIEETKLSSSFEWTSKTYGKYYDEVYSECTCWYCEAIRESHTSKLKRAIGGGNSQIDRQLDRLHSAPAPTKVASGPHISAHNAISPNTDVRSTIREEAYKAKLERDYQKAAHQARKKGRKAPSRDDHAYAYTMYGYPMYMPYYAPYMGDPYISGGMYPTNPGCASFVAGAAGNCCQGACGGGVAAGSCGGGAGGCAGGSAGGCGGGGGGGCGGGGGGGCGGGGGGGGGCGGGGGG